MRLAFFFFTALVFTCPGCGPGSGGASEEAGGGHRPGEREPHIDFAPGGPIGDGQLSDYHVTLTVTSDGALLGDLVFELWPDAFPRAVRRFLRHCEEGAYDGSPFHRVLREFVVQGGDRTGKGFGESPYGSLEPELSMDPQYNHGYGVLALTEPPSLQFFICTADSPQVWGLDSRPISRLGRLVSGVAVLEQVANSEVSFGRVESERSSPVAAIMVSRATVVLGEAQAEGPVVRPPVDLQGQPEVVVVEHLWVTFTERARVPGLVRNRREAQLLAESILAQIRSGELAWEEAVHAYSDEHVPRDRPLPRRRMSNFGVLRLEGQRALIDGQREFRAFQNSLRDEYSAGGISAEELVRRQAERKAEIDARVMDLSMERREDISATMYTEAAFGLARGEVGLVAYDPYGSPDGWYLIRRVE